ncbi:MAG: putative flippase GtrA [Candidatus Paceibacteria bacterium]|jgi:putative flippase GtrA
MTHLRHNFFERTVLYILVGLGVAAFQFLSFAIFFELLHLHYQLSTVSAFILTVLVSYLSQKNITFATTGGLRKNKQPISVVLFMLNTGAGLFLVGVFMYIGVDLLLLNVYVSQFISLGFLALYNFVVFHVLFR